MKKPIQFILKIISVGAFLICLFLNLTAQNTSWKSSGPYGGHIDCLTLSKSNPDILYAGTKYGLYKTEDGGETWKRTEFPINYQVYSIMVHATNPDIVLAGTKRSGAFLTKNGGKSWTYKGLYNFTISTMANDNNNPDVVYFGLGEELTSTDLGIYKIQNEWETGVCIKAWESWGECGWRVVNKILVDPDSSDIIYAAGINSGYCSNYGGFLISQDGGNSWEDKNTGYKDAVSNISIAKNALGEKTLFIIDGGTLTSSGNMKLLKSGDMGDTWQEVVSPYSGELNPNVLVTNPVNTNEIIVGSNISDKPLWIYNNETNAWKYISGNGLPVSISTTSVEIKSDGSIFYLTTRYGGIYKYTATENEWHKINYGINNSYVNDMVVVPGNCNTVYAATFEQLKLNMSTDAGSSWDNHPGNLSASFDIVSVDPNDPSVFYAAINVSLNRFYFYKGENYGQLWTGPIDFVECIGSPCYTEITDIKVKPGDSNCMLLCSKPYFLTPGGLTGFGVVARTTDGGTSWDKLIESPGTAIAIDPQNTDVVYIGKERPGQVFKILNAWGAQSATEITPEEGIEYVQDIIVDNQSNVYIATEDGLWKRSGEFWSKLNVYKVDINALAVDNSKTPSVVYAGSAGGGVFVSENGGDTWITFNNGLGNLNINKLTICSNMIYAGTKYGGVWSRELPDSFLSPFLTHNTGNMKISVFQNGSFGHAAPNWEYGDGVIYKNNIDPLFNSGLIIGSADRGLVNGQLGNYEIYNDFQNTSSISGFETVHSWDQVATCSFNDNSANFPYGLNITQRTYSKSGEDLLLVKYLISNTSDPLNDLYIGIFADWSVGGSDHFFENLGGFDIPRNLVYQYLEGGNPDQNYYGIVALDGISGTRVKGTAYDQYIRDSSFIWISKMNTTELTEAAEYKTWIGSGPYNFDENDEIYAYFAFVAGSSLDELQANADLAAQRYQDILTNFEVNKTGNSEFYLGQNYPNPFNAQSEISYSIPEICRVQLDLLNIEGIKIKSLVNRSQASGQYSVSVNTENLSPGIYFYRIKAGGYFESKKLIIVQ